MSEKFSLDAVLPPFEDERPKSTLIVQGPSVPMPQSPKFRNATGKDVASVLRALGPDERRQIWQSVYGKCSTRDCQNSAVTDVPAQFCVECLFGTTRTDAAAASDPPPAEPKQTLSPAAVVTEAMRDWWGVLSYHDTSVIQPTPRLEKLVAVFKNEATALLYYKDKPVTIVKLSNFLQPPPAPA